MCDALIGWIVNSQLPFAGLLIFQEFTSLGGGSPSLFCNLKFYQQDGRFGQNCNAAKVSSLKMRQMRPKYLKSGLDGLMCYALIGWIVNFSYNLLFMENATQVA